MGSKDLVTGYTYTNADGSAKLPMAKFVKSKNPRCFMIENPLLLYFSQKIVWSDTSTFCKPFFDVFHHKFVTYVEACSIAVGQFWTSWYRATRSSCSGYHTHSATKLYCFAQTNGCGDNFDVETTPPLNSIATIIC